MWKASPEIQIPYAEFELSYARSSGPGGQNVNKVNSKAVMRWNILANRSMPLGVRARLIEQVRSRLTEDGCLVITSDRFRDQGRNREDCFEKLRALIVQAAIIPKNRKASKPSWSSQRRLKESKGYHSEKKKLRRGLKGWD